MFWLFFMTMANVPSLPVCSKTVYVYRINILYKGFTLVANCMVALTGLEELCHLRHVAAIHFSWADLLQKDVLL